MIFISKKSLLISTIFLFSLSIFPGVAFSQVDMDDYAAHQECLGQCYGIQSECEFNALNSWFGCWNYCWDTYGPYSGTWEYSPYVAYYHEGCEIGCDQTFDLALYYCDASFEDCECECIRDTAGIWGWVFGFGC